MEVKNKYDTDKCGKEKKSWLSFLGSSGLSQALLCLLGFFLPGPLQQGCGASENNSLMMCFPCQPQKTQKPEPKPQLEPVGMITRNKDVDLIGGKLVAGCSCGMRNGLDGYCLRACCRDNPGCKMNPPRCWPKIPDPPPPPPTVPDQQMICVPIQMVYYDPKCKSM